MQPLDASAVSIALHRRSGSCGSARQANEIASQIVTKARELMTAAHSDAVSRPDPDADDLPGTMLTPSPRVPTLPPRHHITFIPRYGWTLGTAVLGDTSVANLPFILVGLPKKEARRLAAAIGMDRATGALTAAFCP